MKSKAIRIMIPVILFLVTAVNAFYFIRSSFFYTVDNLPKGEFLYSVMSPNGQNTLRVYRVEIEGIGKAVRGEIVSTDKTYNIYWETGTISAIASWVNTKVVDINGNTVHIAGEPYDSRRQIELPSASAKNRMLQN